MLGIQATPMIWAIAGSIIVGVGIGWGADYLKRKLFS
jgi:hypothetical protein